MSETTAIGGPSRFRSSGRWLTSGLQHAYIWLWMALFVLPFLTTVYRSLEDPKGGYSFEGYRFAFGSFQDALILSLQTTIVTIVLNILISIPAAYAIVRYPIPGKRTILAALNVSLYTPGAVMGLSLSLLFAYRLSSIQGSFWALVAAYVVGTFPLMLIPVIVALRDLPTVFGEAARTLGAGRWRTLLRVEIPLLGPGITAGILLTFVIVFNEFLVTLFIAGKGNQTAALTIYNILARAGFAPSTAALASIMQFTSFVVVLLFFKVFGSRYLKGTYLG
ncbi:MAG: ABC transporter permease subunit [Thermomicrobiales bacterium]|nr:ABC transporter permease subunit [Thermomicrobiales bacterium]